VKNLRGYISSREFMGERCPQHIQNIVLRDYCVKNKHKYFLSGAEYAMKNSYLMLKQLVGEIPNINGIIAYSLFQMPEVQSERLEIYNNILEKDGEIHFALESLKITSRLDINRTENIWLVRQEMSNCPSNLFAD
jgi:sporadic carbohydrate cluster protein (TIGR04323 family)